MHPLLAADSEKEMMQMKKKVWLGVLTAFILIVGVVIWQGEKIVDLIFYDMNATMDLPEHLYDDESLAVPADGTDE